MTRPLAQTFNCEPLRELSHQLLFAPPNKRAVHVRRAERLHDEIDSELNYPLDYITYRITGCRGAQDDSVLLVGQAVLPDLRLIIDVLSRSTAIRIGEDEPVETLDQLAHRLKVSTKTIGRWRETGLRWRWVVPSAGGRKQIAFTLAAVDRFLADHGQRIKRAGRFTQMAPRERTNLIARARRLVVVRQVSLNHMAAHLSRKTGRALQTVRSILERHDAQNPGDPIFRADSGPLTNRQKRLITRAYARGVSAEKIARRVRRSRATVYRVINTQRAAAARRAKIPFVPSPTFQRDDADTVILRPDLPSEELGSGAQVPVDELPESLRPLYDQPAMDDRRRRSLFIRYNYLKYKAVGIRDRLDRHHPRAADLDRFNWCLGQAGACRDLLVNNAMPAVLSVARRHLIGQADRSTDQLWPLLDIGTTVLIEAVDSYNAARSQRFISFLTNRLMQRFASEPNRSRRGKAQRRWSGEQMLRHLMDKGAAAGVHLRPKDQATLNPG